MRRRGATAAGGARPPRDRACRRRPAPRRTPRTAGSPRPAPSSAPRVAAARSRRRAPGHCRRRTPRASTTRRRACRSRATPPRAAASAAADRSRPDGRRTRVASKRSSSSRPPICRASEIARTPSDRWDAVCHSSCTLLRSTSNRSRGARSARMSASSLRTSGSARSAASARSKVARARRRQPMRRSAEPSAVSTRASSGACCARADSVRSSAPPAPCAAYHCARSSARRRWPSASCLRIRGSARHEAHVEPVNAIGHDEVDLPRGAHQQGVVARLHARDPCGRGLGQPGREVDPHRPVEGREQFRALGAMGHGQQRARDDRQDQGLPLRARRHRDRGRKLGGGRPCATEQEARHEALAEIENPLGIRMEPLLQQPRRVVGLQVSVGRLLGHQSLQVALRIAGPPGVGQQERVGASRSDRPAVRASRWPAGRARTRGAPRRAAGRARAVRPAAAGPPGPGPPRPRRTPGARGRRPCRCAPAPAGPASVSRRWRPGSIATSASNARSAAPGSDSARATRARASSRRGSRVAETPRSIARCSPSRSRVARSASSTRRTARPRPAPVAGPGWLACAPPRRGR